jgi:tetratricopeptide (TPR) repeat protein
MSWRDYYKETERRFLEYFLQKGNEWGGEIQGSHAIEYLNKIQGIYDNLHSAIVRAVSFIQHDDVGSKNLWPLWRDTVIRLFNFYNYRGFWREIHNLLSVGEKVSEEKGDIWAKSIFLFFQARIESQIGQRESALAKTFEALRLCNSLSDDGLHASLLHFAGMLCSRTNPTKAREYFEQSLAISRRTGNEGGQASTLYEIGRIEEGAGNASTAEALYEEALMIFEQLDLPREKATLLFQLGILRSELKYLEEALAIYQALGDLRGYAQTLHQMGNILKRQRMFSKASLVYSDAIEIFKRLGAWNSVNSVERDML